MVIKDFQTKAAGVAFGILSAVFVAAYVTTNKYIYSHYSISAIDYSLVFAVTTAMFALVSLLFQSNKTSLATVKHNLKSLLILGIVSAIALLSFTIGVRYTTEVNASILITLSIIGTALFSYKLLRERYTKLQYSWIVTLFIGVYIGVVGLKSFHFKSGDLIILASVLFFAFGNAYSRVVMKNVGGARLVPDARLLISGVLAFIIGIFVIHNFKLVESLLPLAFLSGSFYWLCMKTFSRSVYLLDANHAVILNQSQIFFTSLAGVWILSEHYSIEKFIGSIIAVISIYLFIYRK